MPGTAAQNIVNEYTTQYGVSDIPAMMLTAWDVASQVQQFCLPLMGLAFTFLMLRLVTSSFFQQTFDLMYTLKFLGICMVLINYEEFTCQFLGIVQYFTDSFTHISFGNSRSNLNDTLEKIIEQKNAQPDTGFFGSVWNYLSGGLDMLVHDMSGAIIWVVRAITYCVREIFLVFLIAVGPIAVVASLFPTFESNFNMWLKYTFSVSLWGVTLAVLDIISYTYVQNMGATNSSKGFIPLQLGIVVSYLMAPYLTSKIIHTGASMFMRSSVGNARATYGALKGATKMVAGTVSGNAGAFASGWKEASGAGKAVASNAASESGGGGPPFIAKGGPSNMKTNQEC